MPTTQKKTKPAKMTATPKNGDIYGWHHWLYDAVTSILYGIWLFILFVGSAMLIFAGCVTVFWLCVQMVGFVWETLESFKR